MWIDRNEDGSVTVCDTQFSDTAIEVDSLPDEQEFLTWTLGEPLPVVDASKQAESQRVQAKDDRDTALQSSTYSLADGSEYQVRPQDLSNFQITIDGGVSEEWVLADNTIRLTTVAELQEILIAGIAQGKAVWADYKTTIGAL